jgi:predicted MFS family arabinose efflux permease
LLPSTESANRPESARSTRDVLRTMIISGPLRRVTYPTMITALLLGGISVVAVQLAPRLGHPAASGAVLAAALGIGNLVGSIAVTVRPLGGEPERLTALFVAVIAATLLLASVMPSFPLALGAFFLIGVANAPFFAATLAARSEYAPAGGRAQLFVAIAAFKIAAGSAGTALAGALSDVGPRSMMVVGAALLVLTAMATVIDRRWERKNSYFQA